MVQDHPKHPQQHPTQQGTANGRYSALGRDLFPANDNRETEKPKIDAPQGGAALVSGSKKSCTGGAPFFEQFHASCVDGAPSFQPGAPSTAPHSGNETNHPTGSKKRGREKPDNVKRPNPLGIRLSGKAQALLQNKAQEDQLSPHELAKHLLENALQGKEIEAPLSREMVKQLSETLRQWLVEYVRQGNNLNQLAAHANRAALRGEDAGNLDAELKKIRIGQKTIEAGLVRLQKRVFELGAPTGAPQE